MQTPCTCSLLAKLVLLVQLAFAASAATYGPPLINRAIPDPAVGNGYLYLGVIPQGETVTNFSFFNNNSADKNWITPVLWQLVSGDVYKLVGIGESRQNAGSGVQKFPFSLKFGSALASGPNHVFGWWSGRLEELSGPVTGVNVIPNASIIKLDTAASNPGFRQSCVRPNMNPCTISPNPFILSSYPFGNLYSGPSTGSLAAPFGRLYSIQFETAEVPIPVITSVISLTGFGGAPRIAPGGWVEIFGSRFATATKQWAATDFSSDFGPTLLEGVRVTIGGRPAFISYVSPGQINCVVPDGLPTAQVEVVVTNSIGASVPFRVAAAPRVPALLSPAQFKANGRQYVVALHPDQVFAGPENLVPGVAFRLPVPGDRLTLYGIGFGETIPALPAGKIASTTARLPNIQVRFADISALVEYAGPAAGLVGLSQLNVVVPGGVPMGDVRLAVSVDGVPVAQELWTSVQ